MTIQGAAVTVGDMLLIGYGGAGYPVNATLSVMSGSLVVTGNLWNCFVGEPTVANYGTLNVSGGAIEVKGSFKNGFVVPALT